MAPTPLTLAETASVFGEMLTFRRLLGETKKRRADAEKALLAGVEDMINTVVRQIAFYTFERAVHTERKNGELTAERIGEIWLSVQGENLGPADRYPPRLREFLDVYSALHPFAVLCLRLCLRRLPREFALWGSRKRAEAVSRSAIWPCSRPAAPSIIPNCCEPFGLDADRNSGTAGCRSYQA